MFLSCEHAEEQARRFADLATGLGWGAEVRLHSRDGEVLVRAYLAQRAETPIARGAPRRTPLR